MSYSDARTSVRAKRTTSGNERDLQRRNVLRGVLAAGCAFGMPLILGCEKTESDRKSAGTTANPARTPDPARSKEGQTRAASGPKVSKDTAQYQDMPKGDQKCANCVHFVAESSTCNVVEGKVAAEGWCTLWTKKQG